MNALRLRGRLTVPVVLTTALFLGACGSSPAGTAGPGPGGRPPGIGADDTPSPTLSPAGPWATACSLLTKQDVLDATAGQHVVVSVTDQQESNTDDNDDRTSECRYNTKGVEHLADGTTLESSGDAWVSLKIVEKGADFVFPARRGEEVVTGIGQDAFWDDPSSPTLEVRIGERSYVFSAFSPADQAVTDINGARRMITLKIAKTVMARLM